MSTEIASACTSQFQRLMSLHPAVNPSSAELSRAMTVAIVTSYPDASHNYSAPSIM